MMHEARLTFGKDCPSWGQLIPKDSKPSFANLSYTSQPIPNPGPSSTSFIGHYTLLVIFPCSACPMSRYEITQDSPYSPEPNEIIQIS